MLEQDVYFLGLDLGQAVDFSALAALRRRFVAEGPGEHRAKPVYSYTLRGLKRWPLGTLYTDICREVVELVSKPPLSDCILAIDKTGCGSPFVDMLTAAKPKATLRPTLISAGFTTTRDGREYHVPKRELVAAVQMVLQARRLEIPETIEGREVLERELLAFRSRVSLKTGHESFEADWRQRAHDDEVLAVAIAVWHGEHFIDARNPFPPYHCRAPASRFRGAYLPARACSAPGNTRRRFEPGLLRGTRPRADSEMPMTLP
jgi:hypothetical protein